MRYLFIFTLISFSLLFSKNYRILPLGDSITFGDAYNPPPDNLKHAYRNYLWYKLNDYDYWVDYVGTRRSGWSVIPKFDPENEGHPGWTSFDISNITYNRLVRTQPDIILLHIGSNDFWIGDNRDDPSMSGVSKILNEVDRYEKNHRHHIKVIIATIIDRTYHPPFTDKYNSKLRSLIRKRISQGDDLVMVDMQYGAHLVYNSTDFQDPTHPNDNGYKKMAKVWFNALNKILDKYPLPQKPKSFKAYKIEPQKVALKWKKVKNVDGYILYKNSKLVSVLPAKTTKYTVSGLKPSTKYTFKIASYNERGYSKFSTIKVKTKSYSWLPIIYNLLGM